MPFVRRDLTVPAASRGIVVFAHGSGSSRHSPRNRYVAGRRALAGNVPLREQLDLDSMDLLNVAVGLHAALGIDIPESAYSRVATLDGCIAYLESRRIP